MSALLKDVHDISFEATTTISLLMVSSICFPISLSPLFSCWYLLDPSPFSYSALYGKIVSVDDSIACGLVRAASHSHEVPFVVGMQCIQRCIYIYIWKNAFVSLGILHSQRSHYCTQWFPLAFVCMHTYDRKCIYKLLFVELQQTQYMHKLKYM